MIRWALLCGLAAPMPLLAQGIAPPYAVPGPGAAKALSAEEVRAYLDGEGMGYAKAAELNHYPGPRHVLDAAEALGLSAERASAIRAIRERMGERAVRLGERVVALERELDLLFAGGRADSSDVSVALAEWGRLQGELRAVHLLAHLETTRLLTPAQVKRYDELRGYTHAEPAAGAPHRHDE
jgi:hypothetical protein